MPNFEIFWAHEMQKKKKYLWWTHGINSNDWIMTQSYPIQPMSEVRINHEARPSVTTAETRALPTSSPGHITCINSEYQFWK